MSSEYLAQEGISPLDAPSAEVFLQYKNSAICIDFRCAECGKHSHYDGDFAYILCCRCGATYEMPPRLYPRRVEVTDGGPVIGPVIDLATGESGPID